MVNEHVLPLQHSTAGPDPIPDLGPALFPDPRVGEAEGLCVVVVNCFEGNFHLVYTLFLASIGICIRLPRCGIREKSYSLSLVQFCPSKNNLFCPITTSGQPITC